MGKTSFEELVEYRLAEDLADTIWPVVRQWDRMAQDTIGKQLIRSADSVGANIAEGVGRYAHRDNARFIRIARGSLYETRHRLRHAHRRALLTDPDIERLKPLLDELLPRLNAHSAPPAGAATRSNQP